MSIFGVGIDIVEIDRIQTSLNKYGDKFAKKILHSAEFEIFSKHKFPVKYLAKRFAAKEAFVKALGTGFVKNVTMPHIQIVNQISGQPQIMLHKETKELINQYELQQIHLSISDEKRYAIAQVILEK
ncbi:MAG: holo-ACP synthase [Enterobacterales bacterium]|nr:holo-ACP synthase [Enterobacterales bacterium]